MSVSRQRVSGTTLAVTAVLAAALVVTGASGASATAPPGASDTSAPTAPTGLNSGDRALFWSASRDDVGVVSYEVLDKGAHFADVAASPDVEPEVSLMGAPDGFHYFQVVAIDAAGNRSARSSPFWHLAAAHDSETPGAPRAVVVTHPDPANYGLARVSWTRSTDDAGIFGYQVLANGTVLAFDVRGDRLTRDVSEFVGSDRTVSFQVQAYDKSYHRSVRSAPVLFTTYR